MAEWQVRSHWTPRAVAERTLTAWPGVDSPQARRAGLTSGTLAGNRSHDHAAKVWTAAREVVCQRAGALARQGGDLPSLVDLEMVGVLGQHVSTCERCWRTGVYDDTTPISWIMWAVGTRGRLRRVLEPVLIEQGAGRARRMPPARRRPRAPL